MVVVDNSLRSAVTSLQQFLSDTAQQGVTSPDVIRQQAVAAQFPYPELAAQIFKFLQGKRVSFGAGLSLEDISDAFLALLMDPDAVEALGAGKAKNPWLKVRNVLRNTGAQLGTSLIDVYNTVRATGLGYTPTILELAEILGGLFAELAEEDKRYDRKKGGDLTALQKMARSRGLTPWQIALAALWMRRRKKDLPPTDADLEELFADREALEELMQSDGPWDIYVTQSEALRTLRHFGECLVELAEAAE